jgi:hypothetical protein
MEFYGLRPWELDELWPAEIQELIGYRNKVIEAQNRAARGR